MLRIYLDNCCYNRPFDPPSNPTVIFESSAKMLIQTLIINHQLALASSYVVYEVKYRPDQVTIINPVDFIRILEDDDHV